MVPPVLFLPIWACWPETIQHTPFFCHSCSLSFTTDRDRSVQGHLIFTEVTLVTYLSRSRAPASRCTRPDRYCTLRSWLWITVAAAPRYSPLHKNTGGITSLTVARSRKSLFPFQVYPALSIGAARECLGKVVTSKANEGKGDDKPNKVGTPCVHAGIYVCDAALKVFVQWQLLTSITTLGSALSSVYAVALFLP